MKCKNNNMECLSCRCLLCGNYNKCSSRSIKNGSLCKKYYRHILFDVTIILLIQFAVFGFLGFLSSGSFRTVFMLMALIAALLSIMSSLVLFLSRVDLTEYYESDAYKECREKEERKFTIVILIISLIYYSFLAYVFLG